VLTNTVGTPSSRSERRRRIGRAPGALPPCHHGRIFSTFLGGAGGRRIARTGAVVGALLAAQLAGLAGSTTNAGATTGGGGTSAQSPYIIGGTPASEGAYPFLALLLKQETANGFAEYCGGALIAERWVLTAAHCATSPAPTMPDAVLIGRMVASDTTAGDFNSAQAVFVNPAFNPNTLENDTALIELTSPSPQAELPVLDESQDNLLNGGTPATIIGVGETTSGDPNSTATTVQVANQTVQSDASCTQAIGAQYISSSMMCASQPGQSPCFGDSGGPMFAAGATGPVEIGLVSHGPAQCGSLPTVYSRLSAARTWIRNTIASVGGPVNRLFGSDRVATGLAVSGQLFPSGGSAGAVVLANWFDFADALAGTPLAAAKNAPLLLTPGDTLDPRVVAEIQRILPTGHTVYLLGGLDRLSSGIETQLQGLGYVTVRYAGANRFATAVIIASLGLGNPGTVLEANGLDFPDAVCAGAAAAFVHGAVLLTNGTAQAAETAAYLGQHSGTRYAVGGAAAAADPSAIQDVGINRYETSVKVAKTFFAASTTFGAADGTRFPDALTGGVHIAHLGGPMLLVPPTAPMAASPLTYLPTLNLTSGWVYGGSPSVSPEVLGELVILSS
jgi:putative cell wall-binding protein/V8-like Glu-specific endopeptidase